MIDLILEISQEEYDLEVTPAEAINVSGEPYEGEYLVNPDFTGTILPTKDRVLDNDVTVNPIEVSRVSNPSGGTTVYIGGITNG